MGGGDTKLQAVERKFISESARNATRRQARHFRSTGGGAPATALPSGNWNPCSTPLKTAPPVASRPEPAVTITRLSVSRGRHRKPGLRTARTSRPPRGTAGTVGLRPRHSRIRRQPVTDALAERSHRRPETGVPRCSQETVASLVGRYQVLAVTSRPTSKPTGLHWPRTPGRRAPASD